MEKYSILKACYKIVYAIKPIFVKIYKLNNYTWKKAWTGNDAKYSVTFLG